MEEAQKIGAIFILEIMGKPPEYLTKTLENLISQLDKEEGVTVVNKTLKNPRKVEQKTSTMDNSGKNAKPQQQEFYHGFAEVEAEFKDLFTLVIMMFKYMPAHIDIFSPEVIALTNGRWNDILNELARKLHGYDEVARVLQVEKNILQKKLQGLLEENNQGEAKNAKDKK